MNGLSIFWVDPEELEVGILNDWRCVIRSSAEGKVFSVLPENLKLSGHSHCWEFIRGCYSEKEAREVVAWHMNLCARGITPSPPGVSFTSK
jgi:tRNA A37 methylthiotransferase MiaB